MPENHDLLAPGVYTLSEMAILADLKFCAFCETFDSFQLKILSTKVLLVDFTTKFLSFWQCIFVHKTKH
jgi:hypothetical protein